MDKKLTFSGGEPNINIDDLDRNNVANRAALFAMAQAYGTAIGGNFIISGCVPTLTTGVNVVITAGYIFLNGEILEVEAQTVADAGTLDLYKYTKVTTYDSGGDKTFNDGTSRQTWQKNRGVIVAATAPILSTELDVVDGNRYLATPAPKIVELGDWNMDSTSGINVAHGITDYKKIRRVSVMIRNDADSNQYELATTFDDGTFTVPQGGIISVGSTNVALSRLTGGLFDGVAFDSISYNRGWLLIDYVV